MKEPGSTLEGIITGYQYLVDQVVEYLPRLMVALLVLVLGLLLARLLRMLVVRMTNRLDQFWQRFVSKRGLEYLQARHTPARVVGELVYWLLLLIFITLAMEILGLGVFLAWLKAILNYLPYAVAGLFIILAGFVVSSLIRDLVVSAATSAGLAHGNLLGRTAQIIILSITVVIGIDQIGIDIDFLTVVAGIILAAMLGSIALAFGLGARTHVSNIIAANQLRGIYQIGDKVRIGDIEGRITDITVSRVIVESEDGSVDIPAKLFDEVVTMITEKGA